jgi:hypothetical protein
MTLYPFSRAMLEKLQWSLGTYRKTTPGPASAVAALDRQRGTLTWAEHKQAQARASMKGMKTSLDLKREWLEHAKKGLR